MREIEKKKYRILPSKKHRLPLIYFIHSQFIRRLSFSLLFSFCIVHYGLFFFPTSFGKTKRKRLRWAHNNVLFLAKYTLWKGIQMSLSLPLALALSLGVRGQVKWLTFAHNSQVNYFAVVFLTALHTISTIHQLLWWRWSLYWQLFIGWTFKIRWICIK